MKKLTTLLLAAGLVVSSFAGAQAGEFKPNLQFAEEFTYGDAGTDSSENFNAATRIRFGFDYVASEDLSGTILFQYRKGSWGHNGNNFTADPEAPADLGYGDQFRMRLAYIDWTIPGTDIKARMGRHSVVAPSYAFGSAILDGRADGITLASAINDNINVGFTWVRLDSETNDAKVKAEAYDDDADAVMLNAEFAYDGFKVAPWVMYAHADKNAMNDMVPTGSILSQKGTYDADAFVIGASAELNMFDPFVFALDALYSNAKLHNMPAGQEDSYDGFYVAAKASYKFDNGTASFGGWYSTGNDDNNNDNGFVMLDPGFVASTILFGDNIIGCDGYNTLFNNDSPFGTWGLIAEYAGFSFLENLSHTARVVYVQGTNDKDFAGRDLFKTPTEDDTLVEVDFNSTYQIYKNFSATLELGYVFVDQSNLDGADEQDDIFRSALTFIYKF